MFCKETRKSHTCFAGKKIEARWLDTCQTKLDEPVLVHIKSALIYRHPRKSWRLDYEVVSCKLSLWDHHEKRCFWYLFYEAANLVSNNQNNSPYCSHLSNQSKTLLIVHPIFLFVIKSDKLCFISIQSPIRTKFDRVNPLITISFNNCWAWNNISCMIILRARSLSTMASHQYSRLIASK